MTERSHDSIGFITGEGARMEDTRKDFDEFIPK